MNGKVVLIVLDSFGVGALPDAEKYGDTGSNTLLHICQRAENFALPQMEALGLGKIFPAPRLRGDIPANGAYGKAAEQSAGKDTTVGHWEIAGVISPTPLPTYPNGFPPEVIRAYESAIGRKVLGNYPASGTAILDELGEEHMKTGSPIVYTSADSVFQIAAHEKIIPPETLYDYCRIARRLLSPPHNVGRVIARPFDGQPGSFFRTANRHDFSLEPTGETILDLVKEAGLPSVGVGKIKDIFADRGLTDSVYTQSNMDGVDKTLEKMRQYRSGLIFTNLVDYDMKYGHRRDVQGYAQALMDFDNRLPEIYAAMDSGDILILTADHGCDPAFHGTDHTREYVPILVRGQTLAQNVDLGTRATYADIGATVAELLGCRAPASGKSFAAELF